MTRSFGDEVHDVLSDTQNLPGDFLDYLIQYQDQHKLSTKILRAGGTSTSTPGAVTTVAIAHGLGGTPTIFTAQAANANARGAPAFYLTVDNTNVTLNFVGALTAATSYSWVWSAEIILT